MPTYFSATNSRLRIVATPITPVGQEEIPLENQVEEAWIKINGEFILHQYFPPHRYGLGTGGNFMIDSTHWPHGTSILVEVYVRDYDGTITQKTATTSVYNVASIYEHKDYSVPETSARDTAMVMYYLSKYKCDRVLFTPISDIQTEEPIFSESTFLAGVIDSTSMYICAHGSGAPYYPANEHYLIFDDGSMVEYSQANSIWAATIARIGFGVPPFQSGLPSTTLILADFCVSGTSIGMADSMLFPYFNAYNMFLENQVVVGWDNYIDQKLATQTMRYIMDKLMDGECIGKAIENSPGKDHLVLIGDPFTRIRSVYKPDDTEPYSSSFNINYWLRAE